MPRYFFDIRDQCGFHRDEAGEEFADFDEARVQAQAILPDIARQELPDGEHHCIRCDVRDETGAIVYRGKLTFRGVKFQRATLLSHFYKLSSYIEAQTERTTGRQRSTVRYSLHRLFLNLIHRPVATDASRLIQRHGQMALFAARHAEGPGRETGADHWSNVIAEVEYRTSYRPF